MHKKFTFVHRCDPTDDIVAGHFVDCGTSLGEAIDHVNIAKDIPEDYPADAFHFKSKTHNMIIVDIDDYDPAEGEIIELVIKPKFFKKLWRGVKKFARSTIGAILVSAFVFAATFFVAAYFGAGLLGSTLIAAQAAISTYRKLTYEPPPPQQQYDPEENPGYFIHGVRNVKNPGGPVPFVLGEFRYAPYMAANDFPYEVGESTYRKMLLVWGVGPMDIRDIKVGTTPISNQTNYEIDNNWISGNDLRDFPRIETDDLSIELTENWSEARFTDGEADEMIVMISFPRGLFRSDNDETPNAGFEIQYALDGTDNWITAHKITSVPRRVGGFLLGQTINFTGARTETIPGKCRRERRTGNRTVPNPNAWMDGEPATITEPYTYYVEVCDPDTFKTVSGSLPRGRYKVRVKRLQSKADDFKIIDDIEWSALQTVTDGPAVRSRASDTYMMSKIDIEASDQTNGTIDGISAVCGMKVPVYDPVTQRWSTAESARTTSTNPADLFRFVLTSTEINRRPTSLSRIDDKILGEWWDFCARKGLTFSKVYTTRTAINDILDEIAFAGLATPAFMRNGKRGVVFDKIRDYARLIVTPKNSDEFAGEIFNQKFPHAIKITFANEDNDYQRDTRIVYDDGYTEATARNTHDIFVPGLTSPDAAYVLGRTMIAKMKYQWQKWSFVLGPEHFLVNRGDRIKLMNQSALLGQISGQVVDVDYTARIVTVDDSVTFEPGKEYGMVSVNEYGHVHTWDVTGSGTVKTVNIVDSIDSSKIRVDDRWFFGERDKLGEDVEILEKELIDEYSARLTVTPYRGNDIENAAQVIPAFQTNVSLPPTRNYIGPLRPRILGIDSDETALPKTIAGVVLPAMKLKIVQRTPGTRKKGVTTPKYFVVGYKQESETSWREERFEVGSDEYTILNVEARKIYDIRVQSEDQAGRRSEYEYAQERIIGLGGAPDPIDYIEVETVKNQAILKWRYDNPPLDLSHFKLKYSTSKTATWGEMLDYDTDLSATARTAMVEPIDGQYAIKAVDVTGAVSKTARYAESLSPVSGGLQVVHTATESPAFSGTKLNTKDSGGFLRLNTIVIPAQALNMADWPVLAQLGFLTRIAQTIYYNEGYYTTSEISFTQPFKFEIDSEIELGNVSILSNRLETWDKLEDAIPLGGTTDVESVSARTEIRVASIENDEGIKQWSEWKQFVSGTYHGRWFQFRMRLATDDTNASPTITKCVFKISAEQRILQGSVTTSASGLVTVNFPSRFYSNDPDIKLAINNKTQYNEIASHQNANATSFQCDARNASGTRIARNVGWIARGFGEVAT